MKTQQPPCVTPLDRMILTGMQAARKVHLACFLIRYLAGVKGDSGYEQRALASHTTGQGAGKLGLGLFHDQFAPQHAHFALETILACLFGRKLHHDFFAFR